jgi:hypothetical protein
VLARKRNELKEATVYSLYKNPHFMRLLNEKNLTVDWCRYNLIRFALIHGFISREGVIFGRFCIMVGFKLNNRLSCSVYMTFSCLYSGNYIKNNFK